MHVIEQLAASKRPLIVAHRGSSGTAPENTLAAFRQAIEDGADMVELDARMSKDGELVVLHDQSLKRTAGDPRKVWNLSLREIKTLDAGRWFSSRFAGERVPTLLEVLAVLPPTISINIEVKTDGNRRTKPSFEERLLQFIRNENVVKRVLVTSFDHAFLRRLNKLDPGICLGTLYVPLRDIGRRSSAMVRNVGGSVFTCSITQLRAHFAGESRRHGFALGCYGVNTRRQFEKAMKHGVGLIITDFPREMKKNLA